MSTPNQRKFQSAEVAIQNLFADTTVSRAICRDNLTELKELITTLIAALDDDEAAGVQEEKP